MLRAGAGLSTERDSTRAAAEAAAAAMRSGALDRADLLIVFATTTHGPGFTRVTRTAADVCGTEQVVGCSAAGVLAGEVEVEGGPGVAVLALQGNIRARRFLVPLGRGDEERAVEAVAEATSGDAGPDSLLLLFADSYNVQPEALLRGLSARLPGVPVVGGGASEDGSTGQVSVFCGNAASSNALSGAILAGDLRTAVDVTQAVRRIGRVHRVTRARGNVALELDGRPAHEAFAAVVPATLLEEPQRALAVVLAGLPVAEGGFVARHLLGVDPERGAIAVAAPLVEGQELFFGVRDPHAAREDLQRRLVARLDAWQGDAPSGALYVNCVGRGRRFHGVAGLDTAYIRRHLGTVPVAGFFSGAEFAPSGGGPLLHQYSGVLTLLGPGTGPGV